MQSAPQAHHRRAEPFMLGHSLVLSRDHQRVSSPVVPATIGFCSA